MNITRRAFLRGGLHVAAFAGGISAERAIDWIGESDRPEPVFTGLSRGQFDRRGTEDQKAALAASSGDAAGLIERLPAWATLAEADDDGRWIIRHQGDGVRHHIWPGENVVGLGMDQQPDPAFGAWAASRMTHAALVGEPVYQACQTWIETLGRVERYTALLIPVGRRGMVSVTSLIA